MKNQIAIALASLLALLPASLAGATVDTSKPLLCAVTEAVECDDDGTCLRGNPEDLDIPQFVRIDAEQKMITEHEGSRSSPIQNLIRSDGRLILQGFENGRAWSISISQATGKMSVASSGDGVAFAIFGACTTL